MGSAVELPGIRWSIDDELMVEFLYRDRGPGRLIVYEIALLDVIKRQLRSRHITIEHKERW